MKTKEKDITFVTTDNSRLYWILFETIGENPRKEIFRHADHGVVKQAQRDYVETKNNPNLKFKVSNYPQKAPGTKIIMFEEKHTNRYFEYNSVEKFYKIFLKIFNERYEQGWFKYGEVNKPKSLKMSVEEINALKDEDVKKIAQDKYDEYQRELKQYEQYRKFNETVERVSKEQDAPAAYSILRGRNGYEYEKFEIIETESID